MTRHITTVLSVVALAVAIYSLPPVQRALATFTPFPTSWTGTYEAEPAGTDNVSVGDDHIRDMKKEVRARSDVEHSFSAQNPAGETVNSGRHRLGSARSFYQTAEPANLTVNDNVGVGSPTLDNGRLWVDADDWTLWSRDQTDISGAGGTTWYRVAAVPQNSIILWDQANGDSDCDGENDDAGACPCGFTEATEFRGFTIRGADPLAAYANIADAPGQSCGTPNANNATNCSDKLDQGELPIHTHTIGLGTGGVGVAASRSVNDLGTTPSGSVGNDEPHTHAHRTVLFCRKT